MPINATITASTGPGKALTGVVLPNCSSLTFSADKKILQIMMPTGVSTMREFDLAGVTTFTVSISGDVYTVTVS